MLTSRFQNFSEMGGPASVAERLALLRAELARRDLQGFLTPRADRHQNEYVAPADERLLWLTGFSGSAGLAITLADRCALFVDGRYTIQAAAQTDTGLVEVVFLPDSAPTGWLKGAIHSGDRIGYDPWLHTPDSVKRFAEACESVGASLVAVDGNPIDALWSERPAEPAAPIVVHPNSLAGESAAKKIARVRKALGEKDGLVVSDPHNVAWVFNLRGGDVSHTPLPLAFAYIPRDGEATLFVAEAKLTPAARKALAKNVRIAPPEALLGFVEAEGAAKRRLVFDSATCPAALTRANKAAGGEPDVAADPIALMKAKKNAVELEGVRAAHIRDGAAMAKFLAWFDAHAARGGVTEISAALKLENFRDESGELRDLSFPSISAAGPHAAMPHYRVSESSDLKVGRGFYLIDSGGQYRDGTTDITRTISVGAVNREMRDRYTRVLKGHIAIARAVFPVGVSGAQLDSFARQALWQAGLDFDHGVGHGVGAYLSVHEGPQRIAKTGTTPLEPGMIVSNEPGYYRNGEFGIRIENLVVVEEREIPGAERKMLGFETVTLAPIDTRPLDLELLDEGERRWLNDYHARVRKVLSPLVDKASRKWLAQATKKV